MKGFLLDENLPRRIRFTPSLPTRHVKSIWSQAPDSDIWVFARQNALVIVSKDGDFSNRIMSESAPPWIVHLRFGNMKTAAFHAAWANAWPKVEGLLPANKLICVYRDRIEAFRD